MSMHGVHLAEKVLREKRWWVSMGGFSIEERRDSTNLEV
jgi:hypothetical protein